MDQLANTLAQLADAQQQQAERQLELMERLIDRGDRLPVKLSPYVEGESIEDFLLTFERSMVQRRVPEDEWTTQLMAVLSGKARAAYNEVDPQATYEEVKENLLLRFDITPESSRLRLREIQNMGHADPSETIAQIKTLAKRWLIPPETPEETDEQRLARLERTVVERVTREHYLNCLPKDLRSWVLNRGQMSLTEMARCVREYQLSHKESRDERKWDTSRTQRRPPKTGQPDRSLGRNRTDRTNEHGRRPTQANRSPHWDREHYMFQVWKERPLPAKLHRDVIWPPATSQRSTDSKWTSQRDPS